MAPVSFKPGQNLSCSGQQEALGAACIGWASGLLRSAAHLRALGYALPAELTPYAAARPAPAARARARAGRAAPFAARRDQRRARLPVRRAGERRPFFSLRGLSLTGLRHTLPGVRCGLSASGPLCAAGCLRPARGARRPRGVQGARAGVRGPGALCRRGAAQAGRRSLEAAMCAAPARA